MNNLKVLVAVLLCATSVFAYADSFRLPNGKLIQEGKSKQEIIALAGAPLYQEVETIAVDEGRGGKPIKREILTFRLSSSLGGVSLVVVTIENNIATAIDAKQESRI